MPAYATFLFGQAPPMNHAASHRSGSCDVTSFHVSKKAAYPAVFGREGQATILSFDRAGPPPYAESLTSTSWVQCVTNAVGAHGVTRPGKSVERAIASGGQS